MSCYVKSTNGLYVALDPNIECSNPLIWVVGVPTAFWLILYNSKENLNQKEFRLKYGSLYNSYRHEVYYWGIMVIFFKLSFVAAVNFILTPQNALITGVIIMTLYFYTFHCTKPYNEEDLIQTEALSCLVFPISLIILAYGYTSNNLILLIISLIITGLINLSMIGLITWKLWGRVAVAKRYRRRLTQLSLLNESDFKSSINFEDFDPEVDQPL
jgi:hypothetical protein